MYQSHKNVIITKVTSDSYVGNALHKGIQWYDSNTASNVATLEGELLP